LRAMALSDGSPIEIRAQFPSGANARPISRADTP
jgi:hypothetical protein